MIRNKFFTGLDIGSSEISAVNAEMDRSGLFNLIAQVTQPSKGMANGFVVDINEAVRSVSDTINKLKKKIPGSLGDIYVNISGDDIKGSLSKGMIPLSPRGREITRADIGRCVEAAGTIHLPFDREVIHRVIHKFSVDDEPPIKNPLGLYASRLNSDVYVITANVSHMQNIFKCVSNAGYDIKEIVFSGVADGLSLLDKENPAGGAIIADMGASLTEICTFTDGSIDSLDVVTSGAMDYKSGFKDSPIFDGIIGKIRSRMDALSSAGRSVESVILTGGGSFTDGIVEYMEERLSAKVKIGVVKDVRGSLSSTDSLTLSTAIGLVKYAKEKSDAKLREYGNFTSRLTTAVVDLFNNYF